MRCKRGQFFLLAAVIISAIVITLGASANQARINDEPEEFFEFGYDVKKESNSVIDYEIYNPGDKNIKDFIEKLATEIRDKDPEANFLFIYGNTTNITIENHGSKITTIQSSGTTGPINEIRLLGGSSKIKSTISTGANIQQVTGTYDSSGYAWKGNLLNLKDGTELEVQIEGHSLNFPITKHNQVIFIIQKDIEDESFVTVK